MMPVLIPLNTGEELSKKGDRRGSERRSARTEEENGVNKETVKAPSGRRTSLTHSAFSNVVFPER